MVKNFAIILSILLLLLGIFNLTLPILRAPLFQTIIHMAVGILGLIIIFRVGAKQFLKWMAAGLLVLSGLAFLGLTDIAGAFSLTIWFKGIYLVLGLLTLWMFLSARNSAREETAVHD